MEEPPTKKIKVFTEDTFTNEISVETIPIEVLCVIFSHLDRQSMKSVTATCKLWLETIRGDSKRSSHVCLSTQKSFTRRISQKGLDKRIGDLEFPLVRWPVLKTIEFRGYYSYLSMPEKIFQHSRRLVEFENCPTLEKIIVSGSYNLNTVFSQFPPFGTIEEFTFSPKSEMETLQIQHILSLEFSSSWYVAKAIRKVNLYFSFRCQGRNKNWKALLKCQLACSKLLQIPKPLEAHPFPVHQEPEVPILVP